MGLVTVSCAVHAQQSPNILFIVAEDASPDSHFPIQRQVEGLPTHIVEPEDVSQGLSFVGANSAYIRENTANYYNCINRLDESVGFLLQALKETGKADNTPRRNPHYELYLAATGHFSGGTLLPEMKASSKLIQSAYSRWECPPLYELYDLEKDPQEWTNLSGKKEYETQLKQLQNKLNEWRIRTNDMIVYPERLDSLKQEMDSLVDNKINYKKDSFHYGYTNYLNGSIK